MATLSHNRATSPRSIPTARLFSLALPSWSAAVQTIARPGHTAREPLGAGSAVD